MKRARLLVIGALAPMAAVGGTLVATGAGAASAPAEHVSTSGTDSGNCITSPCATIDYAISRAPAGETIRVAPGTYNQTVDIDRPVNLVGAGAARTTIDGSGIDSSGPSYGVVFVGPTGGVTTVNGFTITNPYPDSYTGGEPEAVALADTSPGDRVNVINNVITEGTQDANAGSDFPIGIDTFKNAATTFIAANHIRGFFQGALLEDNGPASVNGNTISGSIPGSDGVNTYPAEGIFFLSDLAGALTGQNAKGNTLTGYSGYGIAMSAGYSNGNCSTTPCDGSITGTLTNNTFALTGGTSGDAAIALHSENTGNDLTVTLTTNRGSVTAPESGIVEEATGGGTLAVTQDGGAIAVKPSTSTTAGVAPRSGALHQAHHG